MTNIKPGSIAICTLQPGETLTIETDGDSSCRYRQLTEAEYLKLTEAADRAARRVMKGDDK